MFVRRPASLLSTLFLAATLVTSASAQTTWYVDAAGTPPGNGTQSSPYTSIQYAINAKTTVTGDTLSVAAGTYFEAIDYRGKSLQIIGAGPDVTTIDATGQNSSVARMISGEDSTTVLKGFTLTGGTGSVNVGYGSVSGGGILCVGVAPTLEDLVITQNQAGWGGGISLYAIPDEVVVVRDCEVFGNSASPDGGGIYVRDCKGPEFTRVNVHDNSASTWGGGYYLTTDCDAVLDHCVITRNTSPTGGAVILQGDSDAVFEHCTIAENSTGIFMYHANAGANDPVFSNSILWSNGGYNVSSWGSGSGSPTITWSNISGGWAGTGNINLDPRFTSDYHLQAGSPCIDAGDPGGAPDPDGTVADMGAYYFDQSSPGNYCTAKVNSQGCTPTISYAGSPASMSGPNNFVITAAGVLNNQAGVLIWSLAPATKPFGGGTLCLGGTITRAGPVFSGGNPPPADCSGTFSFHFSQAYMLQKLLAVGDTVHAQYWTRDPGFSAPNNIGLTDALKFTILP